MIVHIITGDSDYLGVNFREDNDITVIDDLDYEGISISKRHRFSSTFFFDDPAREGVVTDFPGTPLKTVLVMSDQAASTLKPELDRSGDLFDVEPLGHLGYKLFACPHKVDALDHDRADFHPCATTRPFMIRRYAFKPEIVADLDLFRCTRLPGRLFATDRFLARVDEQDLTGLKSQALWSSEHGSLETFGPLEIGFRENPLTANLTLSQKRQAMRDRIASRTRP